MNRKIYLAFVFMMFIVFALSSVSAVQKDYNPSTKTVTLSDNFLFFKTGEIATAQLLTPLNYRDGLGEQYVWEMKISGFKDYQDFIQSMDFYDKKNGMAKINRDYDLRKKEIIQVKVDDYTCTDKKSLNGTIYQDCVVTGSHLENKEVWTKLKQVDFKKNDVLYVRMYTNVQEGDVVEWIPTIATKEVQEWATWTADLNVNLVAYYTLNQTSGNLLDSLGNYNLTNNGADYGQIGKINYSLAFVRTNNDYLSVPTGLPNSLTNTPFVFNTWFKPDTVPSAPSSGNFFDFSGTERLQFRWANDVFSIYGTGVTLSYTQTLTSGTWHMITIVLSSTKAELFIDGNSVKNESGDFTTNFGGSATSHIGEDYVASSGRGLDGLLDEASFWNSTLTQTQITQLYNGGNGITYTNVFGTGLTVTGISPLDDATDTATGEQTFICYGADDTNFTEMEFYFDGILNQSNSSGYNNTNYFFYVNLADGIYNWSCVGYDEDGNSATFPTRTYTIDTVPKINISSPTNSTYTTSSIDFNATSSFDLDEWKINYNGTNTTIDQLGEDLATTLELEDGSYHLLLYGRNSQSGVIGLNDSIYFNVDATPPEINISSPLDSYDYLYVGESLDLNFTVTDEISNVSSCWWNYNGTNYTVPCVNGSLYSTNFLQEYSKYNITVYSNDTIGNLNSTNKEWNFKILEINKTYNNITIEGAYETFYLYLEEGTGSVQNIILHYGDSTDTSSLYSSGDSVTATNSFLIPAVSSDTNNTFYYTITLSDSTSFNTTSSNQTVQDISIDDCSANPYLILNLSLKDEKDKTALNGTIETNLEVVNNINYGQVLNVSQEVIGEYSPICSNIALNETSFLLNAEIRYSATNHSAEFYHIQRAALTDYPINLSLYDLSTDETTIFKILYRGSDLTGVEGAILQLQRKYIADGTYEIVEAPITSSDSSGIVHVDTNTNKYQITVVKNGEVLGIFQNLAFICQSELTGECTLDLFDKLNPPNIISITSLQDFSYSIDTSIDNQTISLTYSIPSGTSQPIQIIASQLDTILGNSTICNQTVVSSAGTIECDYNTTIQDSVITYKIYKGGELIVQKSYVVQEDLRSDWGGVNYILLVILVLSLVFMALSSPEWMVVNAVVTILIGGGIWLIRGISFVEGLGSVMWLIIGAIILISKLAKQEDN